LSNASFLVDFLLSVAVKKPAFAKFYFIEIFERISGTEREGYFVSVFKWEINDPCESNSASCDKKA
jgi:hypothetical protein